MAEVAAGAGIAIAAEEVLSTTVQVGVAGYFLTKPTQPLKATFSRVAIADDDDLKRYVLKQFCTQALTDHNRRSLARSHHSVTVINDKAYIFGGQTPDGEVATNDIHVINLAPGTSGDPDYQLIPPIADSPMSSSVAKARYKHAARAFNGRVAIFGGVDSSGQPPDDDGSIRLFNPETKQWETPTSTPSTGDDHPAPRIGAKLFAHETSLLLYGGDSLDGTTCSELWKYDASSSTSKPGWSRLPTPPFAAPASNAAFYDSHLYLISSADPMSSQLHILPLSSKFSEQDQDQEAAESTEEPKWTTLTFPTNPIVPGPRARHAGALLPITTGYGRNYLVYLLGARDTSTTSPSSPETPTQWSDTWTLQLPSSNLSPRAKLNVKDAIKPAKIKDAIRAGVGAESGTWSWAEVQVSVPDELGAGEGKLHPGPRAWFGADGLGDGRSVLFWGGEDAGGKRVGDGWVVRLE